jgi:FG-GAP repeat
MWGRITYPVDSIRNGLQLLCTLGLGGLDRKDLSGGDAHETPLTASLSVISADFNSDGVADLAVITPGAELLVLLGTKEGS